MTWNFGRFTIAGSLAGVLVAGAVSLAMPSHYVSRAVVTAKPADEATRGTANNVLKQTVFNREVLIALIQDDNLYPHERSRMSFDEVIEKMRNNIQVISILPDSPGNRQTLAFSFQFEYRRRDLAQKVNQQLIGRFLDGNLNAQPYGASQHLDNQRNNQLQRRRERRVVYATSGDLRQSGALI
jgi:polysaccharide biosynthesis transport protein